MLFVTVTDTSSAGTPLTPAAHYQQAKGWLRLVIHRLSLLFTRSVVLRCLPTLIHYIVNKMYLQNITCFEIMLRILFIE